MRTKPNRMSPTHLSSSDDAWTSSWPASGHVRWSRHARHACHLWRTLKESRETHETHVTEILICREPEHRRDELHHRRKVEESRVVEVET